MKKKFGFILMAVVMAVLMAGCAAVGDGDPFFDFDLTKDTEGWSGDFSDLPVDYDEDLYRLFFGVQPLPAELGSGKTALMLESMNASDDVFMFIKRQLGAADGLKPDTTYLVEIVVEFATNVPAGLFGIGGPPGEALFVKVGAASIEPVRVERGDSDYKEYRLNVNKGEQSEGGDNAVVVGDIAKEDSDEEDWSWILKSLSNKGEPLEITTDSEGNLWIFVGTDSGFEGLTTLYYTSVQVTLTEK
jgi:hypothetical protein